MLGNPTASAVPAPRNLKWLWLLVPAAVVLSSLRSFLVLQLLSALVLFAALFVILAVLAAGYVLLIVAADHVFEYVGAGKTLIHSSSASTSANRLKTLEIASPGVKALSFVAAAAQTTVKGHENRAFSNAGMDGRVAATMFALKRGIVHLPSLASGPQTVEKPVASVAKVQHSLPEERLGTPRRKTVLTGEPPRSTLPLPGMRQ
jgi:hypothetical protein